MANEQTVAQTVAKAPRRPREAAGVGLMAVLVLAAIVIAVILFVNIAVALVRILVAVGLVAVLVGAAVALSRRRKPAATR